ncbi:GNAT family N-acetyltransferase [Niallia sp. 01092]|uniref:GNAT family N-acetyltransferase n=1 Tax=unclassified Niallia TaxID=2837522 RepID=UPI003FD540A0
MIIRKIETSDSENFLTLRKTLDEESEFMMLEPDERQTTLEQQKEYIKQTLYNHLSLILVCEIDGKIVGYLSATRESFKRMGHSAYIIIGILKAYTGKKIGTNLFSVLEDWAYSNNIHRLELTVMTHNEAAIALYKKMGFQIEGTKKHSLMINNQYIDEYYMAKLI